MDGLFVGTAGFDYPDWRGIFFPDRMPRGVHPLTYHSTYFDAVEVNATFYRPARAEHAARWVLHVSRSPGFTFTVKLWQRFTHERNAFPAQKDVEVFKAGIAPLRASGKLGGLLVQFPWSFKNIPENRAWLERVLDAFAEYPVVLEVRHASWSDPEVYAYLGERRVAICNIDQPLFRHSIGPEARVTARLGYVRLHGQNHDNWFRADAGRDARYDYLYSEEELEPWVEKIKAMRSAAEKLYVITNNHYRGQAAVNALQLMHRLKGRKVRVPEPLEKAYPQLASIRSGPDPAGQKKLPGF